MRRFNIANVNNDMIMANAGIDMAVVDFSMQKYWCNLS